MTSEAAVAEWVKHSFTMLVASFPEDALRIQDAFGYAFTHSSKVKCNDRTISLDELKEQLEMVHFRV